MLLFLWLTTIWLELRNFKKTKTYRGIVEKRDQVNLWVPIITFRRKSSDSFVPGNTSKTFRRYFYCLVEESGSKNMLHRLNIRTRDHYSIIFTIQMAMLNWRKLDIFLIEIGPSRRQSQETRITKNVELLEEKENETTSRYLYRRSFKWADEVGPHLIPW